jgi:hypothetical protein
VYAVIRLRVPYNAGKLSEGYKNGGLWISAQLHIVSYFSWLVKPNIQNYMASGLCSSSGILNG